MRRNGWHYGAQAILASGALAITGATGCTAGQGAARVAGGSWLITTVAGGPGGRATASKSVVPCAMTATTGTLYLADGPPEGAVRGYAVTGVAEATDTLRYVAGFGPPGGASPRTGSRR